MRAALLKGNTIDPFVDMMVSSQPALSMQILWTPNLVGFKMPPMEPYDGTLDLLDHVESFKTLMLLHGVLDALLCKVFPMTFRGPMRAWFVRLESSCVHSFD